ncbi:6718_t:CDS:1, partial [Gigaspora rosea]
MSMHEVQDQSKRQTLNGNKSFFSLGVLVLDIRSGINSKRPSLYTILEQASCRIVAKVV